MNYINICSEKPTIYNVLKRILNMNTETFGNSKFKFSARGFVVALAASSMLLMNSFNSIGNYSAGSTKLSVIPNVYADDA